MGPATCAAIADTLERNQRDASKATSRAETTSGPPTEPDAAGPVGHGVVGVLIYLLVAVLSILTFLLGVLALRKCRPEDIPDVLRALFGRK
jgi:hypothetical protein